MKTEAAWKDPHTQNYYTGFAHGTSGIAAAFIPIQ
nr:hypothetical protein [Bacillus licheniformis]